MRILHVVESFATGVLTVLVPLAERSAAAGHEVAVAHGTREESPCGRVLAEAVEVFGLPWSARTPRVQVAAGRALRRRAEAWRPDVVHTHSSFAGAVGAAVLAGRHPVVHTPHGYSVSMRGVGRARHAAFVAAEHFVARRATVIGTVSESEAGIARRLAPRAWVETVANGIAELDAGTVVAVESGRGRVRRGDGAHRSRPPARSGRPNPRFLT